MFEKDKTRKFLVWDGSDKRFVSEVIGVAEMVTGYTHWYNKLGRIKCHRLDRNHPTMKVITIKSGYREFDSLRKILERDHSDNVCFDAPL